MRVLNFGSLNIDYVYKVDHITREGETQHSLQLKTFAGGKGLNQSIAMAKAGVAVCHAGLIGKDGSLLLETCRAEGIDTMYIKEIGGASGHAIIQVDKSALNGILVHAGANGMITRDYVDQVLADFGEGDLLVLQNEISLLSDIIELAAAKKMTIILNPSPIDEQVLNCDLSRISLFIMNETEGSLIAGGREQPEDILDYMMERYPAAAVVLTLGSKGSYYCDHERRVFQPVYQTTAVDTTAAGDTFSGYFIRGMVRNLPVERSLKMAACAAAIAVSREGASASIPMADEVEAQLDS